MNCGTNSMEQCTSWETNSWSRTPRSLVKP